MPIVYVILYFLLMFINNINNESVSLSKIYKTIISREYPGCCAFVNKVLFVKINKYSDLVFN